MRHFFHTVQTPSGLAVAGASIDVYAVGTTNHATIYSDDGSTTTTNPLVSASDGTFNFYVADGRYDLKVSGAGITTRTFGDVEIFDATEKNSGDGTLTANTASFTTLTVTGVATIGTSTTTGNATVGGTLQVTGATTLAAVAATTVNATTGVQINGAAAANTFLKGNGSNYIAGSPTLASADFANQGTTTTVLHGNGAGNPSFGAVTLATDVTGILPTANGGTAQNSTATFPTSGIVVTEAASETLTNKTLTSPVVNGTPTGTGISTITFKKGTGSGNYSSASTSDVAVDGTNLAATITIPTGWKLAILASGAASSLTVAVTIFVGIADGGTTVLTLPILPTLASTFSPFALAWEINGDGAAHTIDLRYHTTNGADSVTINNASSTQLPTMIFILTPSN